MSPSAGDQRPILLPDSVGFSFLQVAVICSCGACSRSLFWVKDLGGNGSYKMFLSQFGEFWGLYLDHNLYMQPFSLIFSLQREGLNPRSIGVLLPDESTLFWILYVQGVVT